MQIERDAGLARARGPLGLAASIVAVGICCAEGGSRVPRSGGTHGYIETGPGPLSPATGLLALVAGSAAVHLLQSRLVARSATRT